MKTYKIAAIPGDGIGTEVIAAGLEVLEACAERDGGFTLDVDHFDWGSDYYKKHGVMMPRRRRTSSCSGFDAIFFGAVGAPDVPDHITLWGLRLAICQPLDQYANVRPTRILPGITSPLRNVDGQGARLGDRARELGRRVCRRRRPRRIAACRTRSPPRSSIFTRAGVDAHHALRLRARPARGRASC